MSKIFTKISIGIVGNPNCGKTTLFNQLTGAHQRVGNWPGVTVDRKIGCYTTEGGDSVTVTDLPGVYSLGIVPGMDSLDEKIARDFIIKKNVDVIVNIVDATNLERNFHLTGQLIEMRVPMVLVLNMMDQAHRQDIKIDVNLLSQRLGCPVVPIVAKTGKGLSALRTAILKTAQNHCLPTLQIGYAAAIETIIAKLMKDFTEVAVREKIDPRWLAIHLLEGDNLAIALASDSNAKMTIAEMVSEVEAEQGEDIDMLIADGRFAFAHGLALAVGKQTGTLRRSMSDAVDRAVILNPILGLPVFFVVMYLMFMFTINFGGAFIDFFDLAFKTIFVDGFDEVLSWIGMPTWLRVILADGVGGGVQLIATFVPIIGFLYLFMSVLEDTGYMARVAFLMDRYMRIIGLPGKSFVPLIIGFGCNVPAIMATRTLEQQRDRTMLVMMAPFMSCGARLAVYALFAAAFFPTGGQNIVFALYLIGAGAAIMTGFVLKHTLLRGAMTPFIMELPPYHIPQLKSVLIHTWNRLKSFIFGAGKLIVMVIIVLSFLNSWGVDGSFDNEDSNNSVLSAIGRSIVPVFKPMGIKENNWPATVGIFTGIFAKEAVVGTLDALYSKLSEEESSSDDVEKMPYSLTGGLMKALASIPENLANIPDLITDPLGLDLVEAENQEAATKNQEVSLGTFGAMTARFDGYIGAFVYLLFVLLYFPCVAALGAINREVGPRWAAFSALWTTSIAYLVSVSVYQTATFMRHPSTSLLWLAVTLGFFVVMFVFMRMIGRRLEFIQQSRLTVTK